MAELKDFENPYAFIEDELDEVEWEDTEAYDEFSQRCKDLVNTLNLVRGYFESLGGISQEDFDGLCNNSLKSGNVLHMIDGYASDLSKQLGYMHGVLTR